MVENSFHSNPFSKIMVFFSSTLVFTCPNKMGWWNANATTFYKLHKPWNFKLNSLLNFGENVHSPPSISSTAYLNLFFPSKHHSNTFTWNHLLTLTSVCLVVSLMLPMSMSLTNSITVPLSVSSLVIPLDKKHTNCSISPPEKYSPAGKYVFTKITFLMLPSSLSFLFLIWATLQAQFLLQFMTQLPLTWLTLLALSLLPPQTLLPLFLSHPIQTLNSVAPISSSTISDLPSPPAEQPTANPTPALLKTYTRHPKNASSPLLEIPTPPSPYGDTLANYIIPSFITVLASIFIQSLRTIPTSPWPTTTSPNRDPSSLQPLL